MAMPPEPDADPEADERRAQFLRGTTDLLLLTALTHRPGHAYELANRLSDADLGPISYATVYPLLTRLHTAGLVSASHQPSTRGPARKVYGLTPAGRRALHRWSAKWHHLHDASAAYLEAAPDDADQTEHTDHASRDDHAQRADPPGSALSAAADTAQQAPR